MAYHGGPTSLPRAHRPRAPIMSAPAPLTAPLAPLRSPTTTPTLSTTTPPPPTTTTTATSTTHQQQQQQQQPSSLLLSTTQHHHHHNHHHQTSSLLLQATTTATPTVPQVSLATPRPDSERTTNEYVETPFRVQQQQHAVHPHVPPTAASSPSPPPRSGITTTRPTRLAIPPPPLPPITKQPPSTNIAANGSSTHSFSKQPLDAVVAITGHHGGGLPAGLAAALTMPSFVECNSRQSIICAECGNCRCPSCQQPQPLPECWLCNNKCLCSADTIIDYASCLCCVKGLFYHCSESDGGESCADNPCACGPDRRTARWGCLGALSCVLPCLWFYWPLQCGKRAVEACYARHSRQGCRCRPKISTGTNNHPVGMHHSQHINTPEKRLLDASPDF